MMMKYKGSKSSKANQDFRMGRIYRAAIGMFFWKPVEKAEIKEVHNRAQKNHEESRREIQESEQLLQKSIKVLNAIK